MEEPKKCSCEGCTCDCGCKETGVCTCEDCDCMCECCVASREAKEAEATEEAA